MDMEIAREAAARKFCLLFPDLREKMTERAVRTHTQALQFVRANDIAGLVDFVTQCSSATLISTANLEKNWRQASRAQGKANNRGRKIGSDESWILSDYTSNMLALEFPHGSTKTFDTHTAGLLPIRKTRARYIYYIHV